MVRVLIADDSPTARSLLSAMLRSDAEVEVIGEATGGIHAVEQVRLLRPDLVTMDIQMPDMDGFEATKRIMASTPTPIVIVSSLNVQDVTVSLDALRAGALALVDKPVSPADPDFPRATRFMTETVKAMARVRLVRRLPASQPPPVRPAPAHSSPSAPVRLVAMGAATGGPAALQQILSTLPGDFAVPIAVVQHMALGFSAGLARWLGSGTRLRVKVAEAGEPLLPGTVYLAPDQQHLQVTPQLTADLTSGPPVEGARPSATTLFASAADLGPAAVTVILTGMGRDGLEGLRQIRERGGHVLAQDEASALVFGMPGAAIAAGVVDTIVPLSDIAGLLMRLTNASRDPKVTRALIGDYCAGHGCL